MFHVELRQFPHQARAFNLTREELEERVLRLWLRGVPFNFQEQRWDPGKARLTIYEGRRLEVAELGLGRGWATATKAGSQVTDQVLAAAAGAAPPQALDELVARLAAVGHPLTLAEAVALADEQSIWQLLREERLVIQVR